jgi:hypothetical protein
MGTPARRMFAWLTRHRHGLNGWIVGFRQGTALGKGKCVLLRLLPAAEDLINGEQIQFRKRRCISAPIQAWAERDARRDFWPSGCEIFQIGFATASVPWRFATLPQPLPAVRRECPTTARQVQSRFRRD